MNYNLLALGMGIFSLAVTYWTNWQRRKNSLLEFKKSNRIAHLQLLTEINKFAIEKPELDGIYDDRKFLIQLPDTPTNQHRRSQYIYLHLNLFESVFIYYFVDLNNKQNPNDKLFLEAWIKYFKDFFKYSNDAKTLWSDPRTRGVYSDQFGNFVDKLIQEIHF